MDTISERKQTELETPHPHVATAVILIAACACLGFFVTANSAFAQNWVSNNVPSYEEWGSVASSADGSILECV